MYTHTHTTGEMDKGLLGIILNKPKLLVKRAAACTFSDQQTVYVRTYIHIHILKEVEDQNSRTSDYHEERRKPVGMKREHDVTSNYYGT